MRKNVIHERKPFITAIPKTGENINDLHELCNEGTVLFV